MVTDARPFDAGGIREEMGAQDGMKKAPTPTVVHLKQGRRPTTADVLDRVLDKGIVIDYQVDRLSLSGIDLPVTVDARFLVASLDTYLEYAEPLNRTGLLGGSGAWLNGLSRP